MTTTAFLGSAGHRWVDWNPKCAEDVVSPWRRCLRPLEGVICGRERNHPGPVIGLQVIFYQRGRKERLISTIPWTQLIARREGALPWEALSIRLWSKILYYGLRRRGGRNYFQEARHLNPAWSPACCVISEKLIALSEPYFPPHVKLLSPNSLLRCLSLPQKQVTGSPAAGSAGSLWLSRGHTPLPGISQQLAAGPCRTSALATWPGDTTTPRVRPSSRAPYRAHCGLLGFRPLS